MKIRLQDFPLRREFIERQDDTRKELYSVNIDTDCPQLRALQEWIMIKAIEMVAGTSKFPYPYSYAEIIEEVFQKSEDLGIEGIMSEIYGGQKKEKSDGTGKF